jgi:hypothetical protein
MDLVSWTPGSAVFWGGLAVMTWATWAFRRRPEVILRLAMIGTGSVGDQAERWLRSRPGA